ncbi:hypothetical protein [Sphingomonas oryzagri]|uniref:Uncharacterized protein n=1 Tax=Sphingomonas oryzagri TaxID=3042314 RepID=A0ABT6N1W6_9SPHN|nr:hypothetical protein [Sphingomonas oryzagri]MDH7639269.1 hypothetical protein [Sphingomonas oryzagri]
MAAIAKITAFPDRLFKARYWSLPDSKRVWVYVSDEVTPHMIAVDLADPDPHLEPVIARMKESLLPFRNARERRAGRIGRFLVSEIGA